MMSSNLQAKEAALIVAGGCFWCLEPPFDQEEGVLETVVGYTGGKAETANYDDVSTGTTKHREAVAIHYDPEKVSFGRLLDIFFNTIDPFDATGQFVDKGHQYTTAIYYQNADEKKAAEEKIAQINQESEKSVATELLPIAEFYPAEEYHQDYYQKNPLRYQLYKNGSGRK